ncbi:MAG: nucleotidyltransferase family protein [Nitrospirae bacterium]|nr:nucleotidyltransferase family protein [Nitrospirota bacterium]MCL5422785.1 nucleotidyltransferase family protein [Nitrospirota bacterium]
MGQLKQLLPVHNKPAVRHCAETVISSGIGDVVVVLSPIGSDIVTAINDLPLNIVFNENQESEMAVSVRTGLRALDPSSSGVLICLCDHTLVLPETIRTLVNLHAEDPHEIIIPVYNNKKGHPTLFPKKVMTEVMQGLTLRDVIQKDPERVLQVDIADEGVILDMDTMEDYQKISQRTIP